MKGYSKEQMFNKAKKAVLLSLPLISLCHFAGYGAQVLLNLTPVGPHEIFASPDVNCHQGYTTDGTFHYTIDTARIDKRLDDANWTCVLTNTAPLFGLPQLNHLGDGKYYQGKLYIVAEWWGGSCQFHSQNILVFDANTLERLEVHDVSAQGHEVSGLTVVPNPGGSNAVIYVTSFCDGSRLFMYDLATFNFLGTFPLSQTLPTLQGVTYHQGLFYVSEDADGLYTIDPRGQVKLVYKTNSPGSHEGLDYSQSELRWLIDAGTGNKLVRYISFSDVAVTWPSTGSAWSLQSSTNPLDPSSWTTLATSAGPSTATVGSSVGFTNRAIGTRFFRLQQN